MKRPRIIPTLLLQDGGLVKTKRFKNPCYLGDPINAIRIFNEKSVDELCVLDITASKEGKEPDYELLEKMASEAFMPLSYGGGVKSVDQIKRIFRLGFEKVVLNTAAVNDMELVRQAADYFGSQSIVGSIDYKNGMFGTACYMNDGEKRIKKTPVENAKAFAKAGAGELLLYAMDNDGMRTGYDLKTIETVANSVNIPVIACGGAKNVSDLKEALKHGANAVAAGTLFVFFGEKQAVLINFPEERELYEYGIYE